MTTFYSWKYLSPDDVTQLRDTSDANRIKSILNQKFNIIYSNPRQIEILRDFHFYNYVFCKEKGFSDLKISTFMSLMNDICRRDISDSSSTRTASYAFFETQLLLHAVERPPKSVKVFEEADLKCIIDYVVDSYFRHFQLYKYVYTPYNRVAIKQTCSNEISKPSVLIFPLSEACYVVENELNEGKEKVVADFNFPVDSDMDLQ